MERVAQRGCAAALHPWRVFQLPTLEQSALISDLTCSELEGGPPKVPSNLNYSPVLNIDIKPDIFLKKTF